MCNHGSKHHNIVNLSTTCAFQYIHLRRNQVRLLRRIVPLLSYVAKVRVLHAQRSFESVGGAVIGVQVLDHSGRESNITEGQNADYWR